MAMRALAVIDEKLADLPAESKPAEAMTPPELLADTARLGLLRLREIVSQPIDSSDPKQQRLIAETALGVGKLFMRVAEHEFRRQQPSPGLLRVLEALASEEEINPRKRAKERAKGRVLNGNPRNVGSMSDRQIRQRWL